jgi:predicted RNase H-like HicB family nuclease
LSRHQYTVLLIPEPEVGSYSVEVPALPGCVTRGDSVEEALGMAQNAIGMWIRDRAADGEVIPAEREAPRLATVEVEMPALVGA